MNNTSRLARIDDILKDVPKFSCVEGCADCCGPITMTPLEWKRIIERTGISDLKEKMGDITVSAFMGGEARCPLLNKETNKCTVYDIRPAICVLYGSGTGEHLECPHGRRPEIRLTEAQVEAKMKQIDVFGLGRPRLQLKKI